MADSRPPDISERVYIDLSGRISAYYDPTTYKYDVAVGESLDDTFKDISVYGIIAQLVQSGKWGK